MSSSHISRLRLIGIIFWLAGGVAITFGWMGMAREACVDCQMPFLLSGGASGLGLIIVGSTLIIIATMHDVATRNAERMAEVFEYSSDEPRPAVTRTSRAKGSEEIDSETAETTKSDTESETDESASDEEESEYRSDTTVMPAVPTDFDSKNS